MRSEPSLIAARSGLPLLWGMISFAGLVSSTDIRWVYLSSTAVGHFNYS